MAKKTYHVRFKYPVAFVSGNTSFAVVAIDTDAIPFSGDCVPIVTSYKLSVLKAYSVNTNAPENLAMHPIYVPTDNIASITQVP